MPWWAWLIAWAVVAVACGVWLGLALANAEAQEQARNITERAAQERNDPEPRRFPPD